MITSKLLSAQSLRLIIHSISCALFLVILSIPPAFAGDLTCSIRQPNATNSYKVEASTSCSGGRCGVCDPNTGPEGWVNPAVEVAYQIGVYGDVDTGMPIYRATIGLGKCKWLVGVRFCVRPAKAGTYGNSSTRPQLCAYEDPCDGMDPPNGNCIGSSSYNGPYHQNSSKADILPWEPLRYSILGSMVGGITSKYNHIVTRNVGCIDRKIGPIPPTWSNNAWFNNSLPIPTFEQASPSVFESPRIKVKVCKDGAQIVACSVTTAVEDTSASVILNPNQNAGSNPQNIPYKDCKTTNDGGANSFGRQFCASITTSEPDKIKIVQVTDGVESDVISLDRPGYIPKPVVTATPDSTNTSVKMNVILRGQSIVLGEAPTEPKTGTLHQVPFAIVRPCVVPPAPGTACTNFQNMVCAIGYNTAPFVAAYKNPLEPGSPAGSIADLAVPVSPTSPNEIKTAGAVIANTSANQENGAYLPETFRNNLVVYKGSGGDFDRPNPITSGTTIGKHYLRPISAHEAGLCIFTPPDTTGYTYTTPGTYTYTVPVNCSQVTATLWGGGAAGKEASNGGWTGGSGALVASTLNVMQNDIVNITVGSGGGSNAAAGGNTVASVTRGGVVIGSVTAGGGLSSGGAVAVGTSSGTNVVNSLITIAGIRGIESDDGWGGHRSGADICLALSGNTCATWGNGHAGSNCASGGNGHHGDSRALMGGGGCSQESWTSGSGAFSTYHESGYSLGGHGRLTISCSRGLN